MIKKKYFVLLVTLLLVLLLGCCTTSLGYTWDDLVEYATQIKNSSWASNSLKTSANLFLSKQSTYKTSITNAGVDLTTFDSFIFYYSGSYPVIMKMFKVNSNSVVTTANNKYVISNVSGRQIRFNSSNSITTNSTSSVGTMEGYMPDYWFGLQTGSISNYYNLNLENKYTEPVRAYFTPDNDGVVTYLTYTGVNACKYDYSVPNWKIGTTTGFSDLEDYIFQLFDTTTNSSIGFIRRSIDKATDGALYYSYRDNTLYVNSRYIQYNRVYDLGVSKQLSDDLTQQEQHYFVFLPLNATISGGAITDFGSGDFNVQDSTNQIIDNITDSSEVDNLLDLSSGDLLTKFGFHQYDTNWFTFVWDLLNQLKIALLSSGNVSFTFPYMKTTITLYATDFTTPSGPLKSFCRDFLVFATIVLVSEHIYRIYNSFQEADVQEVLHADDIDDESFLM